MSFTPKKIEPGTLGFLKVALNDNKTHVYPIMKNQILTCGREDSCDISIQNTNYISKIHFRVWCTQFDVSFDPICYIQDLSLNGTYIFNSKIDEMQKINKNQIKILEKGNTILFPHQLKMEKKDVKIKYVAYQHKDKQRSSSYENLRKNDSIEEIGDWKLNESVLGSGSFGVVFGCYQNANGLLACCKIINNVIVPIKKKDKKDIGYCTEFNIDYRKKHSNKNPFHLRKIHKEKAILKDLNHPNIVKFYDSKLVLDSEEHIFGDNYIYKYASYLIYQELGAGGDLFSFLINPKTNTLRLIDEEDAIVIIYQIMLALRYLHSKNIAHRDLKLDNIIMATPEPCTRILLTDFGISKKSKHSDMENSEKGEMRLKTCVGTPEYTAPEVGNFHKDTIRDLIQEKLVRNKDSTFKQKDNEYTLKCDVWSLGVLIYYLLTGKPFFGKENKINEEENNDEVTLDMLQSWIYKRIDNIVKVNNVSNNCLLFLKKVLTIAINDRYSIEDCFKDEYIQDQLPVLEKIYQEKILSKRYEITPLKNKDKQIIRQKRSSNYCNEEIEESSEKENINSSSNLYKKMKKEENLM